MKRACTCPNCGHHYEVEEITLAAVAEAAGVSKKWIRARYLPDLIRANLAWQDDHGYWKFDARATQWVADHPTKKVGRPPKK